MLWRRGSESGHVNLIGDSSPNAQRRRYSRLRGKLATYRWSQVTAPHESIQFPAFDFRHDMGILMSEVRAADRP